MKKILLASSLLLFLFGCSSNQEESQDTIEAEELQEVAAEKVERVIENDEIVEESEEEAGSENETKANDAKQNNNEVNYEEKNEAEEEKAEETNDKMNAKNIYVSFFEGLNEENLDKISSVLDNEEMIRNYGNIFEEFELNHQILEEKLVSTNGENLYEYEIKVRAIDEGNTEHYQNNESIYKIEVDTNSGQITFFEILETINID